jgi:Spy/CpxP family protein refolding chaperone
MRPSSKRLPTFTAAAMTLAAVLATVSAASARGRHGGHPGGGMHSLSHHHGQHLELRDHRHQIQRHFFTRFTPCVVWTRQGWTDVCARPR